MTDKTKFEENLGALTPEQFDQVKAAVANENGRRVSPEEFRKKVSEMSPGAFDHFVSTEGWKKP